MDKLATIDLIKAVLVIVSGAVGTYLLLPHKRGALKPKVAYYLGGALTAVAVLTFALLWTAPSDLIMSVFFYGFGIAAVAGGVLTVTSKNPVYSALWFASVVLSTSGLFMLSGAQFLAAGTIIVYAGAIIVTFLFVIMLAQIEKLAAYDRSARSPGRAVFTAYLLLWSLVYAILLVSSHVDRKSGMPIEKALVRETNLASYHRLTENSRAGQVLRMVDTPTSRLPEIDGGPALGRHVAGLGGTLFTDHLISVELAGSLLFIALVGALAIASPKPPVRPANTPVDASKLI